MISGLEKFAIIKAQKSKRYKVENNVVPKYEIDEYDLAAVEEIYDEIQFIMATQGYKMNDAKSTINEVDKMCIRDSNYTQQQISKMLNISRQAYSNYETSKRTPDLDSLIRLSQIYHVSLDELVNQSCYKDGIINERKGLSLIHI